MVAVQELETAWDSLSPYLKEPHTEEEYDHLVNLLNELIDEVGQDEHHPLAALMDLVGTLIEKYEDENVPEPGETLPPAVLVRRSMTSSPR